MKKFFRSHTTFALLLLLVTLFGCENNSGQIEILTQEKAALSENYNNQLMETKEATERNDSLVTVINRLESEIQKLKGERSAHLASSEDEKAIEAFIGKIHQGWTTMVKTKDTNELLKYFLPKYTTGSVRIDTENIPTIKRSNDTNFEAQLQDLIGAEGLSISFGQTRFLYTEIKGDIFVTSYRTKLRLFQNNKEAYTSSLVVVVAGQYIDEWKVGSYNWVTLNY